LNNGCTVEEIREALLHCAVYAGVPAMRPVQAQPLACRAFFRRNAT